jgi:hypothetical protein
VRNELLTVVFSRNSCLNGGYVGQMIVGSFPHCEMPGTAAGGVLPCLAPGLVTDQRPPMRTMM